MSQTEQQLPIYRHDNTFDCTMPLSQAVYHAHEGEMILTSKGRGRNRRYTSGRWLPRPNLNWRVLPSAGYSVLQLVDS